MEEGTAPVRRQDGWKDGQGKAPGLYFSFFLSPHLILTEVPQGELMHFVLKSQFVRRWLGLHTPPARPCPGQCPVRAGLAEIPSLERAMEGVFAVSSGECDVMSLVGGQAGRDWPPWVQSGGTGLIGAGRAPGDILQGGVCGGSYLSRRESC